MSYPGTLAKIVILLIAVAMMTQTANVESDHVGAVVAPAVPSPVSTTAKENGTKATPNPTSEKTVPVVHYMLAYFYRVDNDPQIYNTPRNFCNEAAILEACPNLRRKEEKICYCDCEREIQIAILATTFFIVVSVLAISTTILSYEVNNQRARNLRNVNLMHLQRRAG